MIRRGEIALTENNKIQLVGLGDMNGMICDAETGLCMIPGMEPATADKDNDEKDSKGDKNENNNLVRL